MSAANTSDENKAEQVLVRMEQRRGATFFSGDRNGLRSIVVAAIAEAEAKVWDEATRLAQAHICDHGSKATYEALKLRAAKRGEK